jgi:hypothetical protein
MAEVTFTFADMVTGEARTETGFTTRAPGLVVWRVRNPAGQICLHTWSLTHVSSGLRVGPYFKTRSAAESVASQLADFCDWTQDKEAVLKALTGRIADGRAIFANSDAHPY